MASTTPHLEIFTAAELAARQDIVCALVSLINTAFSGRDGFPAPRFFSPDELVESLGSQGLCAAIFDDADQPIATASIKLWGIDPSGTDFEVSIVAALETYRGKGLADRCVRAVEKAAVERDRGKELKLWLRTVQDHNGEYWARRGFEVVETEKGPVGMWGAEREFIVATMTRPAVLADGP